MYKQQVLIQIIVYSKKAGKMRTELKHSSYTTNKAKNLSEFEMISQFSKNKYQIL